MVPDDASAPEDHAPAPEGRDLEVQIARLEHALGRVADESLSTDDQASAAEQAAQAAGDAGAALDRMVRETGGGG